MAFDLNQLTINEQESLQGAHASAAESNHQEITAEHHLLGSLLAMNADSPARIDYYLNTFR